MADGADRIWGYLSSAVAETNESDVIIGASTGRNSATGTVDTPEGDNIAHIRFTSEAGKCTYAEMSFDPELTNVDEVAIWAKAVMEGASSKGFPADDWKH